MKNANEKNESVLSQATAKHAKDAVRLNGKIETITGQIVRVVEKYRLLGEDLIAVKQVFDADKQSKMWTSWVGKSVNDGNIRLGLKTVQKCMQLANEFHRIEKGDKIPTSLNEAIEIIQADKRETGDAPKGSGTKPKKTDSEKVVIMANALESFIAKMGNKKLSADAIAALGKLGQTVQDNVNGKAQKTAKPASKKAIAA